MTHINLTHIFKSNHITLKHIEDELTYRKNHSDKQKSVGELFINESNFLAKYSDKELEDVLDDYMEEMYLEQYEQ